MESSCKSTDSLHDGKLCVSMPTANEPTPPSSTTEDGLTSTSGCEPSPSNGVSKRIERLVQVRSEYASAVEFEIEASKVHWSELNPSSAEEGEINTESDLELFARLQKQWPLSWGEDFFQVWDEELVPGEKIAEGAQAEIFLTKHMYSNGKQGEFVLKVFKEGYSLQDLANHLPHGILEYCSDTGGFDIAHLCAIRGATLLKDGRLAFDMMKYWGDLRKLIDFRMERNGNEGPPFTDCEVGNIVVKIALGMQELHKHHLVHRDLKASNVLIARAGQKAFDPVGDKFEFVHVADYECSPGVLGTGYWRAPEILQGIQGHDINLAPLFTEKSDVYSYAMTFYEVLTGCIPFEDRDSFNDYNIVLEGQRPELPEYVDPALKTLLSKCWHADPSERPPFADIVESVMGIYPNVELPKW